MLKKIFAAVLVLSLFLIESTATAGGYQKYLGGDRNYIIFDGHQGVARYIVRNSLKVETFAEPSCIISIDWVTVPDAYNGSTRIANRQKAYFGYTWKQGEPRKIFTINLQTKEMTHLPRNVSRAGGEAMMKAAEMTFYLVTGQKFYGFSDSFYPDL